MTARRGAVAILLVTVLLGGCTGRDEPPGAAGPTTTPPADATTPPDAPGGAGAAPEPTSVFSGVTTAPTTPAVGFEISIGGAVTAKASGTVRTRCIQGKGFFDVEVTPDVPLAAGDVAISSVVFGAPGFRGPGRYDAARADDAEWSVGLIDADGAPREYYSPLDGAAGSVTVADDGKSGRFDIRGLVDDDGGTLTASGAFTCGTVER